MNLTEKDRLFLINQYEIRKMLTKESEIKDLCDRNIDILEEGFEGEYFNLLRLDSTVSCDVSQEVRDILIMYNKFEWAYEDEDEVLKKPFSRFVGFDGNEECSHLNYMRFIFKHEKDWCERVRKYVEDSNLRGNSHCPVLPAYRKMLNVFKNDYLHKGKNPTCFDINSLLAEVFSKTDEE